MKHSAYFFKSLLGVMAFFPALFLAAGTFDYPRGWLLLLASILGVLISFVVDRGDAELIREREGAMRLAKPWDKKILGGIALLTIIAYVVAGFEHGHLRIAPLVGVSGIALGLGMILGGQLLFIVAKAQNRFFSTFARIQSDRGHHVCDRGLYRIIRHPGYAGLVLSSAGIPLVTGSRWCIVPTSASLALIILRTALEDKMLRTELQGYADYAKRVPWRLLPLVF